MLKKAKNYLKDMDMDKNPVIWGRNKRRYKVFFEAENGEIYTGFCIESASGVMALCAERVACLNMYAQSGQTVIKRMIAFRDNPPKENGGMPCGACREFLLQLSPKNKDIEILTDYESRKTVILNDLIPNWWGWKRYENK